MSSNNVDWDRYEHVLESLGVLARLTENKKLSIREGDLDIDNDKKFQFIIRWWNSDDHDACLENVKQTVNEAIHMARMCLNEVVYISTGTIGNGGSGTQAFVEKQRSLRRFGRLTESLECAVHGIETQKVTYKNDEKFCARVDVITGNIRDELQDMDISLKLVATPPPQNTASTMPVPNTLVGKVSAIPPLQKAMTTAAAVHVTKQKPCSDNSDDDDDQINDVF